MIATPNIHTNTSEQASKRKFAASRETKWFLALLLVASFGGALRKWVVDSSALSNGILGIQMIIPFLMVYFKSPNANNPFKKYGILTVYFFYMAFHIIYPLQLTYMHGIFGILVHGGFWLGLFFYFSNRHLFQPSRYINLILIVVAIEVVLAFIQYQLPQTHFLNKYSREGQTIAVVGDKVRVTGTFSYLSGFTAFLIFYPLMVLSLLKMKYPQWFVLLALALGISVSFMSGSRSAVVVIFLLTIPVILSEYPVRILFQVVGKLIMPALIIGTVLMLFKEIPLANQIELAYNNFMGRVETNQKSGEQASRFVVDLWYIQNGNYQHPVFGIGLGSTYQGATALFGTSPHVYEFGYVESEFSRVLLEGGWTIILLKVIMGLMAAFTFAFKGFMRWSVWFVVALAQPIVFNPHNAAFLLLGIILVDNIVWRQKMKLHLQSVAVPEEDAEAETTNAQPALPILQTK